MKSKQKLLHCYSLDDVEVDVHYIGFSDTDIRRRMRAIVCK